MTITTPSCTFSGHKTPSHLMSIQKKRWIYISSSARSIRMFEPLPPWLPHLQTEGEFFVFSAFGFVFNLFIRLVYLMGFILFVPISVHAPSFPFSVVFLHVHFLIASTVHLRLLLLPAHRECPLSEDIVFDRKTVATVLSCLHTCGLYDNSGEWGIKVGLPAKAGVSGCLMIVIPKVMGLAIYSPRVDVHGTPIRGIELAQKLSQTMKLSIFDQMILSAKAKENLPARMD